MCYLESFSSSKFTGVQLTAFMIVMNFADLSRWVSVSGFHILQGWNIIVLSQLKYIAISLIEKNNLARPRSIYLVMTKSYPEKINRDCAVN